MIAATLLAVVLSGPMSVPEPPRDRWFAEDKIKHFVASFVVTSLAASGVRTVGLGARESLIVGGATGVAVGVYKEIRDARTEGETASIKDLLWDLAGTGAALGLLDAAR